MIKNFRHKGLARLFNDGDVRGVNSDLVKKCEQRLRVLDRATKLRDVSIPGWRLHQRKGADRRWSIDVNGPWRILFQWDEKEGEAYDVDLEGK